MAGPTETVKILRGGEAKRIRPAVPLLARCQLCGIAERGTGQRTLERDWAAETVRRVVVTSVHANVIGLCSSQYPVVSNSTHDQRIDALIRGAHLQQSLGSHAQNRREAQLEDSMHQVIDGARAVTLPSNG